MVTQIDHGFSGAAPTSAELVARARAMIPALKQRARQCTTARNVPAQTIAEMRDAGFFRILQPKRWGGYEMHPNVFYDVQKVIAEGCMSTGWVYGVLGCHPFELALFPDQAQRDVWGRDHNILVSSSYQPVGKVTRGDGGFYLSGRWNFSSGSLHCGWVLLGAVAPPEKEGGLPELMVFLLPRADYEIHDDVWHVFGLQGTGSHDIAVDNAFVPAYRVHRANVGDPGTEPGHKENNAPLYTLSWAQVFIRSVNTAAFGGAHAAINAATAIMQNRVSTNTGKASKDDPILHAAIAAAKTQCAEMELALKSQFDELMAIAIADGRVPIAKRAFYAYQAATVVRRLARLIDDIVQLLGGRAIFLSSEVIQPWLDINAARAHVINDPNTRTSDMIATELGHPPAFGFL